MHLPPRVQSLVFDEPLQPQESLQDLHAKEVSPEEVQEQLRRYVCGGGKCSYYFRRTLEICLEVLRSGPGGIMLVVVNADVASHVLFEYVDGGVLTEFWREAAKNIHLHRQEFERVLEAFCRHSDNDRWDARVLQELEACLPSSCGHAQEGIWNLDKQPKDGAIVLSHRGTVLCAAGHLRHQPKKWRFRRTDGKSCGTRHAGALGCAEALGHIASPKRPDPGVVFVRSDAGRLHVILPSQGDSGPRILALPIDEDEMDMTPASSFATRPASAADRSEDGDPRYSLEVARWRRPCRARTLDSKDSEDKMRRASWRKSYMHTASGLATEQSPMNRSDSCWSVDDMARLMDSIQEPLSILAVAGVRAPELQTFMQNKLSDHRTSSGLALGSSIVYEASGCFQVAHWPSAFDAAVKVFRVPVPEGKQGSLGPGGLNLRVEFGLHALAVEFADGSINFTTLKDTEVTSGCYLWVCFGPGKLQDLKRFLGAGQPGSAEGDPLQRVTCGTLPLFSLKVPQCWHAQSLAQLNLPSNFGIRVVGCQAVFGMVSLLPDPSHVVRHHDRLFLTTSCLDMFVAQRSILWCCLDCCHSKAPAISETGEIGGYSSWPRPEEDSPQESDEAPELGELNEEDTPSTNISETEEDRLRREVARLRAENEALRRELEARRLWWARFLPCSQL